MKDNEGLRILVVEDEPFIRQTIRAMLRRVGCPFVEEAPDGERALATIGWEKPDVILCDLEMKPMGGLEFLKKLREHANPELRDIPVIMLTGNADPRAVQAVAKFTISGYLVKPVSPKQLADRLDRLFKGRRLTEPAMNMIPSMASKFG